MCLPIVFLVIVSIIGCNSKEVANLKNVVRGSNEFTANSYKELIKISPNDNIIVSGLSAEIVLYLLTNGAKGETRRQLQEGLGLPGNLASTNDAFEEIINRLNVNTDYLKLLSANKIYPAIGFPISENFKDLAVSVFKSDVQNMNYSDSILATNTINQWVEDHTNNKIKNLIDPSQLNESVVLVLVNALYFSGQWLHSDHFHTQKKPFHTSATDSKEIDTMYTETWALYSYNENLKAKFLDLGFAGGNVSMTFVLPDSKTGLSEIEDNLVKYLKPQKMEYAKVAISLPKFTIDTKINYVPILKSFGIQDVFSPHSDLSGISDAGKLKVSFVVQKAFIDVNENGVEAAAATAGGIVLLSMPLPPPPVKYEFKADRPFFFFIREKTSDVTLFAGRFQQ